MKMEAIFSNPKIASPYCSVHSTLCSFSRQSPNIYDLLIEKSYLCLTSNVNIKRAAQSSVKLQLYFSRETDWEEELLPRSRCYILFLFHGFGRFVYLMALPCHGKAMARLRDEYGKAMTSPRQSHGKANTYTTNKLIGAEPQRHPICSGMQSALPTTQKTAMPA